MDNNQENKNKLNNEEIDKEEIRQKIEKKSYIFLKNLSENKNQIFSTILLLLLIPVLIFIYAQFLCNGKFLFESKRMVFNFILIYCIIGIFYSITGRIKLSLLISMILIYIVGLINITITTFRGTPLVPWDIFSVNVAMSVLPTFKFRITKKMVFATIYFIIGLLSLKFIKTCNIKNKSLNIGTRLICLFLIIYFLFNLYTTDLIKNFELNENWDPKEEYHNNGLVASLFKQSKNLIIKLPEGYSIDALKDIMNNTELEVNKKIEELAKKAEEENEKEKNKKRKYDDLSNTIVENTINDDNELIENTIENTIDQETIADIETEPEVIPDDRPNIIVIMNESFADLQIINRFNVSKDYMPYIKSLDKKIINGNVHVSVFGATTPNTEWEFLTANSMAFVPYRAVPYQQYMTRKSYSIASILKEQGYSTFAIHPYYPQGYNRNIVYPLLGFDKYYNLSNMGDLNYIREYPDDKSTYDFLIDKFENKKENEKIFNFTLTMQNHGSYTDENFTNEIIAENGEYPKLDQYLTLIKETDDAYKYLLDYFKDYDEHVIILMFGDHQPYVEDEFYENLFAKYPDPESKEVQEKKYITPYLIWANYDIDQSYEIKDISINYLSSLLLDIADVKKSIYMEFLDNMRERIPVITGNGYMDKNNIYHTFDEENEYSDLIKQYNYLQYNNMFDKNNKLDELFRVSK